LCINLHRTFRGFAAICGATIAVGGAAALSNAASAQTPAPAPAMPAPAAPMAPAPPMAPAMAAPAPAAAPASTATPWTYQGLFDGYFAYDGNLPKGSSAPTTQITGYDYAEQADTPTLALAELNIAKAAPAAGGLGFKSTLIAGETATLNVVGNDESRWENVQQLFVTYALANGTTFEAGKFYTPFGYEVTESDADYNYTRSFIFSDLLPVYHVGVSVTSPTYKGFYATGYIVRSILNGDPSGSGEGVYDQNKSAGYVAYLNYTAPSGKFTAIETYGGSHDGPNGSTDKLLLSDTDLIVTPDAVDTFGLNYTNRQDVVESDGSAQYDGFAAYYRRQINTPYAVAFRAEDITSKISGNPHVDSLTATFEDKATKSLLLRLEFRHDDLKDPSSTYAGTYILNTGFVGGNPNGVATQNTITLGAVYTFGP
jgi:hypothetical protein